MYQFQLNLDNTSQFSFDECLWFLDRNYDECLHIIGPNYVRKAVELNGIKDILEIKKEDNVLIISTLLKSIEAKKLEPLVYEWLDLERDILPFYKILQHDKQLSLMAKSFAGLRLIGIPNCFEAICWSIIGQQINLTFAYSLKRRLTENFGDNIEYDSKKYWLFPKPDLLADLKPDDFRPFQFSQKKAEYIIEIGRQFAEGRISKEILAKLPTNEAIKLLCSVRGIGEWTANYTLMKSLHRLDCITHGDAGLYQALHRLKGFDKKPDKAAVQAFFDNYKGWEAYLTLYLWRSLALK